MFYILVFCVALCTGNEPQIHYFQMWLYETICCKQCWTGHKMALSLWESGKKCKEDWEDRKLHVGAYNGNMVECAMFVGN